jgi:Flp pilus assembly protein TadG
MTRARSRLRSWYRSRSRNESGAVAIVVAAFSVAMFGFAAIVVDLGQARDLRVQMQTTADAAALAATNAIYASGTPEPNIAQAVAAAKKYAADNLGVTDIEWASCTDPGRPTGYLSPAGETACISFSPSLTRPGLVRVGLPTRTVTSAFSGAIGKTPPRVTAAAEAQIRVDGRAPCALCILGGGTHNVQQGDVTVRGGDIYINGSLTIGSNGITAADTGKKIFVQGSATGSGTFQPTPTTGRPALADPLATYPWPQPPTYALPPTLPALSTTPKTDPCTQGPGIYGSVAMSGNTDCILTPGLYVIAGGSGTTWSLSGNGATTGTGVTLLFTCGTSSAPRNCNAGEVGASLDGSGGRTLKLSAPTSGPLWGFTLVYDRNNAATYEMAGNASSIITGTVYMPASKMIMSGGGCMATYGTLVLVGDLGYNGNNTCLKATYDPTKGAQVVPDNLRLTR